VITKEVFSFENLVKRTYSLFIAVCASDRAAKLSAEGLVEADARGLSSHGLMLLPMYLERIEQGSVDPSSVNEIVSDLGALISIDCHNGLGQVSAQDAMELAIERAKTHGVAVVVAKNAFHFGGAYRYSSLAAAAGMIGVAAANTRPLMPVPGGAYAVVGNNPISFSIPRLGEDALTVDFALSEAALGKVRLAEAEGTEIPSTWATDSSGKPTTNAADAIKGMLLPAGGSKGFGLALVIDMLSGVLSGGGFGAGVKGLYADFSEPYNSSNFFLAINASALDDGFAQRATRLAIAVHDSPMIDPGNTARLPGERSKQNYERSLKDGVQLNPSVVKDLEKWEIRLKTRNGDKSK
jgi:LDH2 family malate/lactate/ureidoglycolate dehydrogenase